MLAATRHTRRTNERTRENIQGKGKSESERERACNTHLAATRHTRRTNEWPAAAQWCALRDRDETETSLSQREGKRKRESEKKERRKQEEERKQTGRTVTSSPSLDRTRSSESFSCVKVCGESVKNE